MRIAVRWVARIGSLLSIGLVLLFLFGEQERGRWPTASEWIGLSLWPLGVSAGMVLGWFRERSGGWLTLLALAGFYLWHAIDSGSLPRGPWFVALSAPGLLFLFVGRDRA